MPFLLTFTPSKLRSMTNLGTESNPVWGWAGAERVNSHMAAAMPGSASIPPLQIASNLVLKVGGFVRSFFSFFFMFLSAPSSMIRRTVTAKAQPCDEIVEKLFLGTKSCASSPEELKKRSIELTIGIGNNLELDGDEVVLHCDGRPRREYRQCAAAQLTMTRIEAAGEQGKFRFGCARQVQWKRG